MVWKWDLSSTLGWADASQQGCWLKFPSASDAAIGFWSHPTPLGCIPNNSCGLPVTHVLPHSDRVCVLSLTNVRDGPARDKRYTRMQGMHNLLMPRMHPKEGPFHRCAWCASTGEEDADGLDYKSALSMHWLDTNALPC